MVFRAVNLFENHQSLCVDYFCNKMSQIVLRLYGAATDLELAGTENIFHFLCFSSAAALTLDTQITSPHNISVSQRNIQDFEDSPRLARLMVREGWRLEVVVDQGDM